MSRRARRSAKETEDKNEQPEAEASEPAVEELPQPPRMSADLPPPPAPVAAAPVTQLPDRTPKVTVQRAFVTRRNEALVKAFFVEEKLTQPRLRKLTRAEWAAEFEKFLRAPRG